MDFYHFQVGKIRRKLPIVYLGPKLKIASINLLGDRELVELLAKKLSSKVKRLDFDFLVGPEVKVVPLLQELSRILRKKRYIVCRKGVHGYMQFPLKGRGQAGLVLDGIDAALIKGKKIVIVDDVVSSGNTICEVGRLVDLAGAQIIARTCAFKQGKRVDQEIPDLVYLYRLPIFT